MSCPVWRIDCTVISAAEGAIGAARGVGRIASGSLSAADTMAGAAGQIGFALPFIVLGLLIWLALKLLRFGGDMAVGAADVATGGVASGVMDSTERTFRPRRVAKGKGRSPGNRAPAQSRPGRKVGHNAGAELKRRRSLARGLQVGVHDATCPQLIDRANSKDGKPQRVVVCASDPGAALGLLTARMAGHRWGHGGSKPCDLKPKQCKHFTFRKAS